MKTILKFSLMLLGAATLTTGCIEEIDPQTSTVTAGQVAAAPNALDSYVSALTSSLCGTYKFGSSYPYDLGGYPSFLLQWGVMGQDLIPDTGSQMGYWYYCSVGLGPRYLICQFPWTYFYGWINNCNLVLGITGTEPTDEKQREGAGLAYAVRAFCYMDLARMFAQKTYASDPDAETVPKVTESTIDLANNPRATNADMWAFILEDLDAAEALLKDYDRGSDKTKFDVSVVYGLKARAYLTMENYVEAERYAKLAQAGYTPLTEAQWLDRMTAFNTPNDAWMLCVTYKADDPAILENDSDTNWGAQLFLEVNSGGLYASAYGDPKRIDAHLYSTIPATDYRKKAFVDPAVDALATKADQIAFLEQYSDYADVLVETPSTTGDLGYLQLKFRAGGGEAGRLDSYKATVCSVPLMRVEEMMLIEAEAVGMQAGREAEGKTLLQNFAQLRDPSYTYNNFLSFRDNVWWQRRVELWGESAIATFDIKRLNKGIIRSYAGTDHPEGYRYNTDDVPQWMTLCIVQTETNYNLACTNNPTPVQPSGDSPEYTW